MRRAPFRRAVPAAALAVLALCGCGGGKGEADPAAAEAARRLAGRYVLDVPRSALEVPPDQRRFFLDANKTPPRYEILAEGGWTMTVPLDGKELVREGRWERAGEAFLFTPTKLDGSEIPAPSFQVRAEEGRLVWQEDGTSYLQRVP